MGGSFVDDEDSISDGNVEDGVELQVSGYSNEVVPSPKHRSPKKGVSRANLLKAQTGQRDTQPPPIFSNDSEVAILVQDIIDSMYDYEERLENLGYTIKYSKAERFEERREVVQFMKAIQLIWSKTTSMSYLHMRTK